MGWGRGMRHCKAGAMGLSEPHANTPPSSHLHWINLILFQPLTACMPWLRQRTGFCNFWVHSSFSYKHCKWHHGSSSTTCGLWRTSQLQELGHSHLPSQHPLKLLTKKLTRHNLRGSASRGREFGNPPGYYPRKPWRCPAWRFHGCASPKPTCSPAVWDGSTLLLQSFDILPSHRQARELTSSPQGLVWREKPAHASAARPQLLPNKILTGEGRGAAQQQQSGWF